MMSVRALSVSYGPVRAVQDVDLAVSKGELVTLLGPNGAGKSSTLLALMRLIRSEGNVVLDGAPMDRVSTEDVVRAGMTLVPEGRRVFAGLSVEENLRLGGATRENGTDSSAMARMYEWFPVLGERRRQFAGTLSGGEQQQLAIGRALMSEPKMLLLDEPSLGLAPKIVEQVFERIQVLRAHGTTILMVEQNVRASLEIADRGYVLVNGKVAAQGTAADLRSGHAVEDAYLGLREGAL
jgi:branched-chain amino acid transport system ATP-binding protein